MITVVVLIFGEISPKSVAKDFAEAFAMFSAPILRVIMTVLVPFNWIFGLWKILRQSLPYWSPGILVELPNHGYSAYLRSNTSLIVSLI